MFYPEDDFKMAWDLGITIVLLVACILTPLSIAFEVNEKNHWSGMKIAETIIDILFLMDMIIIFNSAYYKNDVDLIEDRAIICCEYLKGWFTIDLVSIIPIDLIFNVGGFTHMLRITRVGRLTKLVKLAKLLRVLKIMKD